MLIRQDLEFLHLFHKGSRRHGKHLQKWRKAREVIRQGSCKRILHLYPVIKVPLPLFPSVIHGRLLPVVFLLPCALQRGLDVFFLLAVLSLHLCVVLIFRHFPGDKRHWKHPPLEHRHPSLTVFLTHLVFSFRHQCIVYETSDQFFPTDSLR